MTRTFTCILCPNGCEITASAEGGKLTGCEGNRCPRGREYVRQELTCPMRNIATSVTVRGGALPLCPVRLTGPIPTEEIFRAVGAIHAVSLEAPVRRGQTVLQDLLGLGVDVIATRAVSVLDGRDG